MIPRNHSQAVGSRFPSDFPHATPGETQRIGGPAAASAPRTAWRIGIPCLLFGLSCATTAGADDKTAASTGGGASSTWPLVEVSIPRVTGLPTLEARSADAWLPTPCTPPCKLRLNPLQQYRISGDGVVDSEPFRLPVGVDRVRVDVAAGSTLVRDSGTAFTVGGLLFAAGGGAILLLPQDDQASSDAKTGKTVVGVGFLTMGVLTAALGVLLHFVSDTSVRVRATPEGER